MKTIEERAKTIYKYSPNDSIEIPAYLKGRQEEREEWEERFKLNPSKSDDLKLDLFSSLDKSWYAGRDFERAEWEEKIKGIISEIKVNADFISDDDDIKDRFARSAHREDFKSLERLIEEQSSQK